MEIGKQIRELRLRRGVTQETLAEALGCSAQAVSKWEREESAPDIGMLPQLSAYFGVTIDQLFALSDDARMERIQNMIWDERYPDRADVKTAVEFLTDKGRREPENSKPFALLAELENHMAAGHRSLAAEYAKEALKRDPNDASAHSELVQAMGGKCPDWSEANHCLLIDYYKDFLEKNPDNWHGYLWLIDQLLDDFRFDEAEEYCQKLQAIPNRGRGELYRGIVAWYKGDRAGAQAIWDKMTLDGAQWLKELNLGDFMARAGELEKAKAHYRRSLELQEPPRYTDGTTSIARICEMQGDYAGAIAAREEEIAILAHEWNTVSGETVDQHRREIARLREKLG